MKLVLVLGLKARLEVVYCKEAKKVTIRHFIGQRCVQKYEEMDEKKELPFLWQWEQDTGFRSSAINLWMIMVDRIKDCPEETIWNY